MRSRDFVVGFYVATGLFAAPARAQLLFETATPGPVELAGGSGNLIDSNFFLAVNFQVTDEVTTETIGAHLLDFNGGTPIFGAIVALTDPFDYPDSFDLSTPDVVGDTLMWPTVPSSVVTGELVLDLSPGWYALVLGSGRFGATGAAIALNNDMPIGTPLLYALRQADETIVMQALGAYLRVSSHVRPPAATFTRIADTATLIPGTSATFTGFAPPHLHDGDVVFRASGPLGPQAEGIYTTAGGLLRTVANLATPIPGGAGVFTSLANGYPSISNGQVAFRGQGAGGQSGIYLDTNGALSMVANTSTSIPSGSGTFASFSQWVSISDGAIAFLGNNTAEPVGVYKRVNTVWKMVADLNTPIPGIGASFDIFPAQYVPIDVGKTAFRGISIVGGVFGLYREGTFGFHKVVDTNTAMPGEAVQFELIGNAALRNGMVAFVGADSFVAPTVKCVYGFANEASTPVPVACLDTPVPDGTGTFTDFHDPSFNGSQVAFRGRFGLNSTGVYVTSPGGLTKILAVGDGLEGKLVADVELGWEAFDGNDLALRVAFTDGSSGIYLTHYSSFVQLPGDINGDGVVDEADVGAFSAAVVGTPEDPSDIARSDLNGDGYTDGHDVPEFVAVYLGG